MIIGKNFRHLHQKREQGTGNREQGEIIDNLWIRIDLIFDFHQMSFDKIFNSAIVGRVIN
ncbi:hypothetical protein D5R40_05500 [Okeania hirsuta]|uniref:Uncharacterized protein n=1 Tax=Okeania hirsuta TaxID=1458930 RepID=A0A3N6RWR0_9CYAN|nr:hypothetical protein D4Z78_03045 [Okeania hirsuta]RQH52013.1 hypothetical protein D5R40_05500 [Okeania hirsuta]